MSEATTTAAKATPPRQADGADGPSSSDGSFNNAILDSLFTPGLNNPTHKLMNRCFYALFVVLFLLIIASGGNIHVVFLSTVAVALFVTINWFITELNKMPPSVRQPQQMPSGEADGAPSDKKSD